LTAVLNLEDHPTGRMVEIIQREIRDDYRLDDIPFEPGDVVLDIGAHVGVVSTYLAIRHPDITIYAFEPIHENFARLCRNLEANNITNVHPIPRAVTRDGRDLTLASRLDANSGGATAYSAGHGERTVRSTTLRDIFTTYRIQQCRLLKIDVEGAEYEILHSARGLLDQIDYIRGEFHINGTLARAGYNPLALVASLGATKGIVDLDDQGQLAGITTAYSPDERVRVTLCAMCE
jgi:FkbM family methyltransferase